MTNSDEDALEQGCIGGEGRSTLPRKLPPRLAGMVPSYEMSLLNGCKRSDGSYYGDGDDRRKCDIENRRLVRVAAVAVNDSSTREPQ